MCSFSVMHTLELGRTHGDAECYWCRVTGVTASRELERLALLVRFRVVGGNTSTWIPAALLAVGTWYAGTDGSYYRSLQRLRIKNGEFASVFVPVTDPTRVCTHSTVRTVTLQR